MGYIAFVLDEKSKAALLEAYPVQYPRILAHHVTLKFGVTEESMDSVKAEFGDFTQVSVRGFACDDATTCVAVVTGNGVATQSNGTPLHVTISVANGCSPVQAGKTALLGEEQECSMTLTGTIQYVGF